MHVGESLTVCYKFVLICATLKIKSSIAEVVISNDALFSREYPKSNTLDTDKFRSTVFCCTAKCLRQETCVGVQVSTTPQGQLKCALHSTRPSPFTGVVGTVYYSRKGVNYPTTASTTQTTTTTSTTSTTTTTTTTTVATTSTTTTPTTTTARPLTCLNGGVWNTATSQCDCVGGKIGQVCDEHPRACSDLHAYRYSGYIENVYLKLTDNNGRDIIIQVHCKMLPTAPFGRAEVYKYTSSSSFSLKNLKWDDFNDGFHVDKHSFFIGLRKLYILFSSGSYTRMQILVVYKDGNHVSGDASWSMSLQPSGNYELGSWPIDVPGDKCLPIVYGVGFSASDKDVDKNPNVNCAYDMGFGWWHSECNACNPNNIKGFTVAIL